MSYLSQTLSEHAILVVDDDVEFTDGVRRSLLVSGHKIVTVLNDSTRVLPALAERVFSAILLDWVMPDLSGADLLPAIVRQYPQIPVIIVTGIHDLQNVVSCVKQGAYDYLTKPLDTARLVSVVANAVNNNELVAQNRKLTEYLLGEPLAVPEHFSDIVTCSERMLSIFKVIESFARSSQPVLITGETGVGKELVAQAIHRCSGLGGSMVTVNAAGLDDEMLGDTLFGHKRGAFTGATDSRDGLIEQAKGGTLFLDEIGDLSTASQVKLLRLVQQNEYYRIGSDVLRRSDARIIAASNVDFSALLRTGSFRSDLYYRMSAQAIHIPPLRERREDILPLIWHYAKLAAQSMGKPVPRLARNLSKALISYNFPGNVRELINLVSNAVTKNKTGELTLDDFPTIPEDQSEPINLVRRVGLSQFVLNGIFHEFPTIDEVETLLIEEALAMAKGNKRETAELLGISRPTLDRKMERIAADREGPTPDCPGF